MSTKIYICVYINISIYQYICIYKTHIKPLKNDETTYKNNMKFNIKHLYKNVKIKIITTNNKYQKY